MTLANRNTVQQYEQQQQLIRCRQARGTCCCLTFGSHFVYCATIYGIIVKFISHLQCAGLVFAKSLKLIGAYHVFVGYNKCGSFVCAATNSYRYDQSITRVLTHWNTRINSSFQLPSIAPLDICISILYIPLFALAFIELINLRKFSIDNIYR